MIPNELHPVFRKVCDDLDEERREYRKKYNMTKGQTISTGDVVYARITEGKTFTDIGKTYNVSGQRIRQIFERGWRKLVKIKNIDSHEWIRLMIIQVGRS